MSYDLPNKYYPYYRATPDYAYETALKAEATARLATQKADYTRDLHKGLDERTRNIERDVKALEQRVTALEPKKVMIDESIFLAPSTPKFTPIFTAPNVAVHLLDSIAADLNYMLKEGKSNGRVTWLDCAPQHITRLKRMAQGTQDNAFVKEEITLLRADINNIIEGHEGFYSVTIPRIYENLAHLEALIPVPKPAERTATEQLDDVVRALKVYAGASVPTMQPSSARALADTLQKVRNAFNTVNRF